MFKKAIMKLEEEMKKDEKSTYIQYVGQYMIEHLQANHIHAENILKVGKTLIGSLKHMEEEAKKKKNGNVAVLTPKEGFKCVMNYYEINEEIYTATHKRNRKVDISLDDLL